MSGLTRFVLEAVPPSPARLLEVGCGAGKLALALAAAGHDVTAIDPEAPSGEIFRRTTLEDLDEAGPFDAVVASYSLHHLADLGLALDRIAALLPPGGALVLNEFAWDRLDEPTAAWYRDRLAERDGDAAPASLDACRADWEAEHEGLHGYAGMRPELDRNFRERLLEWRPYLHHDLKGIVSAEGERALIEAGSIRALGFRYVGERR